MLQYLNRTLKWIQKCQMRRAAFLTLQHMTDKQLKDIGVTRGELRHRLYNH